MDRNTTVAFVLIGLILMVWLYFQSPAPQPQKQAPAAKDTLVVEKHETKQPEPQQAVKEQKEEVSENYFASFDSTAAKEKVFYIENDKAYIELTSKGARVRRVFLKGYDTWYAHELPKDAPYYKKFVQLVNEDKDGDFNISFVSKDGKLVNTADALFNYNENKTHYKLSGDDSLVISFAVPFANGGSLKKEYVIKGNDYGVRCNVAMENMQNIISNYRYDVSWNNGIEFLEENTFGEATYANASVYSGDEQIIIDSKKPGEKVSRDMNGSVDWVAIRNKYFVAAIVPKYHSEEGGAFVEGMEYALKNDGRKEIYSAGLKVPFNNTAFQMNSFLIYLGPVEYDALKAHNANLEKIVDFGSFFGLKFVIRPISEYVLLPMFNFLHTFIPNYGWVIIVFTLLLKLVLYPLTKSSFKSMKKMQLLQPKIQEIKEKFKEDPQKVNAETMKLYSTYGINPAGGCLPVVLQMPILIALYGLFNSAIELRNQPFMLWVNNLSSPDIIFTLPFKFPIFGIEHISGLALLVGLTMYLQQEMSVKDPSQKFMVYLMPPLFTLMFMNFSSGLNLYYLMFNVFSLVQQYYVNHHKSDMVLEPVKNPKKKGGFMQKMMEAAEKNAQVQKDTAKKKNPKARK